jgi:colicin import membrane protein
VVIIKSSGSAEFDRSVVNAVRKAESFPELQQFSRAEFEQNFREIEILFNPDDLRR